MYREGATSRICLKEKSKRSALKVILKNRRGWCRHRVVVVVFIFVSSPSFLSALPSLINGALKAVEEDEEGSTKPSKSLSHRSRNPRPRAPLITLSYQQPPNDEMPSLLAVAVVLGLRNAEKGEASPAAEVGAPKQGEGESVKVTTEGIEKEKGKKKKKLVKKGDKEDATTQGQPSRANKLGQRATIQREPGFADKISQRNALPAVTEDKIPEFDTRNEAMESLTSIVKNIIGQFAAPKKATKTAELRQATPSVRIKSQGT
ncbi:hypothetical protein Droror1_Dr00025135 [Drosera rotundifolia]